MKPDFHHRAEEAEIMDSPDCDEERLRNTLRQFESINRLFSWVRLPLRRHVLDALPADREAHVVDLGAGGCDLPVWLLDQAEKRGRRLRVTAIDADPRAVAYARERHRDRTGLRIVVGDAFDLSAHAPVDFIIGNHFLHHLPASALAPLLETAARTAQCGVLFTDLRRSALAYRLFQVAGGLYRDSFAREDGLLSIRKGFRRSDLDPICAPLGYTVRESFPFRVLVRKERYPESVREFL